MRMSLTSTRVLAVALGLVFLIGLSVASWKREVLSPHLQPQQNADVDSVLRAAATKALGKREGAILVLDPRTGRIRALVNPRFVFQETFAPGSTIKPFTTLAALRSGVINENSTMVCGNRYKHAGFEIHCTHLKLRPPFTPSLALAYSCNYYFAKVGEGLNQQTFNNTLSSFGLGSTTGTGDPGEAGGVLPTGRWTIGNALGEQTELRVTPVQMLTAYSALVNGGHLFTPQEGTETGFTARLRRDVTVAENERSLIIEGMRGAVTFGTAAKSGLDQAGPFVFGKTGTSTPEDDYHTDGWFMGFYADKPQAELPEPSSVRLGVLVLLKRSKGAEAAETARTIMEAFRDAGDSIVPKMESSPTGDRIRVKLLRQAVIRNMTLDDYVFGVLAAEGSTETELESLKALAIVIRTYAIRNPGRHASDGYDFCNNTHCERYLAVNDENERPEFYALLHRAVNETTGQVIDEQGGGVADAYFSASCGGRTANLGSLWGGTTPGYLRGVHDEFCEGSEYERWTDRISSKDMLRALRDDPRTDVGSRLDDIRVLKRDLTGRAETIALMGERTRTVRGWDFKIIVGRTLGWQLLKSSRFVISRAGQAYIFNGSGFGHGLGLCQLGAHEMARRGALYSDILSHYFPGTSVGKAPELVRPARTIAPQQVSEIVPGSRGQSLHYKAPSIAVRRARSEEPRMAHASLSSGIPAEGRQQLSSGNFRASFPSSAARRDVEAALSLLEAARSDLARRLTANSIGGSVPGGLELYVHPTTGDFVGTTGQPPWVAAVTRGRRIETQPLEVLRRRGVFTTALRHEFLHAAVEQRGSSRVPRWLAEGMAGYFAGEGPALSRFSPANKRLSLDELEARIASPSSAEEMHALYAAAYREVLLLIRREGEAGVWRKVWGE